MPGPVQGSLTDPLDAAVAAVMRLDCLGCGRTPPRPKTGGSGLDQTWQKWTLEAVPVGPAATNCYRRVPRDAPDP